MYHVTSLIMGGSAPDTYFFYVAQITRAVTQPRRWIRERAAQNFPKQQQR